MDSAVSGLIGVALGAVLAWGKDAWRERQERKRHASYLAARLVCILYEFCNLCSEVVADDGTCQGERNPDGNLYAQVAVPDGISFPDDVDWKSIDVSLMYRILALPSRITIINKALDFIGHAISTPPDFEEYFEERQYRYASLALDVVDLANELRNAYDLPDLKFEGWDPVEELRRNKSEIERLRGERERQHAATIRDLPPVENHQQCGDNRGS